MYNSFLVNVIECREHLLHDVSNVELGHHGIAVKDVVHHVAAQAKLRDDVVVLRFGVIFIDLYKIWMADQH